MSGPLNSIGTYWTDEAVIATLKGMSTGVDPVPSNVIVDDPYRYHPSNLPEDVWFYVEQSNQKDSEHGSWKAKGEPSKIFSDSSVTGLRTTLEFFEGKAPLAQRTNWVMQDYSIIQNGFHGNKTLRGSKLLCRVFSTSETNKNHNSQQNLDHAKSAGGSYLHPKPLSVPDTGSSLRLSVSQARRRGENNGPLGTSGEQQHHYGQMEDLLESDFIARGEYLELDDLVDQESLSARSNDTSCITISSDEYFESMALLKDIEDEINKGEGGKRANFKCNAAATAKPDEVVIQPVTVGSLIGISNGGQTPNKAVEKRACDSKRVTENAVQTQHADGNRNRSTSSSEDKVGSSSSDNSVPKGGKKQSGRKLKKLNRKYLCFMPF